MNLIGKISGAIAAVTNKELPNSDLQSRASQKRAFDEFEPRREALSRTNPAKAAPSSGSPTKPTRSLLRFCGAFLRPPSVNSSPCAHDKGPGLIVFVFKPILPLKPPTYQGHDHDQPPCQF